MSRTGHRGGQTALVVIWIAALCGAPVSAMAQDSGNNEGGEAAAGGRTLLQRITVPWTNFETNPYGRPAAGSYTSGEDLQDRFGGDVNEALRSNAGTFTRQSSDQPGITPNIRGLQGQSRVNATIDGVPQTFTNLSGHGGTFDNFVYVDPNLVAGIGVTRGPSTGAEGMGALAGAVNFRTLEAEDVLRPGKTFGAMTTWRAGTNEYGWSGMSAAAARAAFSEGEISVIGAYSLSEFNHYDNGDGEKVPFNPSQMPQSGLFKVAIAPNANHRLKLGGRWYSNAFYVQSGGYDWSIDNQTYTANYEYTPGNDWFDLRANAYHNITEVAFDGIGGTFSGRSGIQTGTGFDVTNTSRAELGEIGLRFNYGFAFSHDDYEGNDQRGANPDGTLIKSGTFAEAVASYGIFDLTLGLRYDTWNIEGVRDYDAPGAGTCPPGGSACPVEMASRSGSEWNPRIGLSARATDWLQLYASYGRSYRAPTASEMFYPGGHNFNGVGDPIAGNLDLVPEIMWGLDIGANITAENLVIDGDNLRFKLGYFDNRIDNFITYGLDQKPGEPRPIPRWVNVSGTTRMNGFEIEGGYDAGFAYANLAVTIADTEQPLPYFAGIGTDVGRLPDDFATLDIGARFLDRSLTLGGRMNYVGDSVQAFVDQRNSIPIPSYVTVDIYGSWQFSEQGKLFASLENVGDVSYVAANAGFADSYSGKATGRGRTFLAGASLKF